MGCGGWQLFGTVFDIPDSKAIVRASVEVEGRMLATGLASAHDSRGGVTKLRASCRNVAKLF